MACSHERSDKAFVQDSLGFYVTNVACPLEAPAWSVVHSRPLQLPSRMHLHQHAHGMLLTRALQHAGEHVVCQTES